MLLPTIETIHEAYHIGFPADEAVRLNQLSQSLFHQSNGKFDGIDIMVMIDLQFGRLVRLWLRLTRGGIKGLENLYLLLFL